MDIYTRILDDNTFGGNWLENQLQEGWNFTLLQPSGNLISPLWNGTDWIEGATEQERVLALQPEINSIISRYDAEIERLCLKHMIRRDIKGIPIPPEIEIEYDKLESDCNAEIKEILPTASYSRPSNPGKQK
ncbi:MAG: hypothetical protein DCE86_05350 [Flavobacteriaceae bacterium]|nr:MAG: hypothetical protein DCE86_05350 [Flavobacteriaceae bacterium]